MKPITDIDDPRYVKALAHPLRIRILAMLADRSASPVQLSARLDPRLPLAAEPHAEQTSVAVHPIDLVARELELVDDGGRVGDAALAQLGQAHGTVAGVAEGTQDDVLAALGEGPCGHARIVARRAVRVPALSGTAELRHAIDGAPCGSFDSASSSSSWPNSGSSSVPAR